ncbi:FitA-like ribbon-helix-helix domain-containing protein [Roseateles depolymerans]|nr:Arc family DNA-binding protein [Roseateles depolymerans]REG22338.1 plasmid stability protein [Roseateles depolymerans]
MATFTVRDLSEETRNQLKRRAKLHGRSLQAEVRQILQNALRPAPGLGTSLVAIGGRFGGVETKWPRSKSAVRPAEFE